MKIAIIRQKFVLYGGAEQFADGYIHQLANSGHEVHIFANQWTRSNHKNIHYHEVATLNFSAFFRTLSFSRRVVEKFASNNLISFRVTKKLGHRMFTEQVMAVI